MPNGTDHMPDKESIMRFVGSDQGKALLGQLNRSDPEKIRAAAAKASAGDISGAMRILRELLSSGDDRSKKEVPHGK